MLNIAPLPPHTSDRGSHVVLIWRPERFPKSPKSTEEEPSIAPKRSEYNLRLTKLDLSMRFHLLNVKSRFLRLVGSF